MKIQTIQDALNFVYNSGVSEWQWGGNASLDGFAYWIFRNLSEIDPLSYEREVKEYLAYEGEHFWEYI